MGVKPEDLIEVKSIVTALGYLTRSSVATIKTNKKISALENEYLKMRSNVMKFESVCIRFPHLEVIDSFPTGLITVFNGIVAHLNGNPNEFEDEEILIQKVLEQGKKVNKFFIPLVNRSLLISISFMLQVCPNLTEGQVQIVNTPVGLQCQLTCVICSSQVKLSSSRNASTGKSTFSVYNFSRHLMKQHSDMSSNQLEYLSNQEQNYMHNDNETQYSGFMQLTECVRNFSASRSTPKSVLTSCTKYNYPEEVHAKIDQNDKESELLKCAECDGLKKQVHECMQAMTECKDQLRKSQDDIEKMKDELKGKGMKKLRIQFSFVSCLFLLI